MKAANDAEKARAYLDGLDPALLESTEIKAVQSALDLAEAAIASGNRKSPPTSTKKRPPMIRKLNMILL